MSEIKKAEVASYELQEEEPNDGVPIVLVTGASGFVATHLIKQLLEQGHYRVRGTVVWVPDPQHAREGLVHFASRTCS